MYVLYSAGAGKDLGSQRSIGSLALNIRARRRSQAEAEAGKRSGQKKVRLTDSGRSAQAAFVAIL